MLCHLRKFLAAGVILIRAVPASANEPANDDFANRTILAPPYTAIVGYNFGADVEGGEAAPNTNTADRSVWYGFTAPVEGSLLVTVDSDTSFEPQVVVARGSSLATLTNLFATSIFGGATIVSFRTDVQGGSNYVIRVDGRKNFLREGSFVVTLDFKPDPANDDFADRTIFGGGGATLAGEYNFGADVEGGEPAPNTNTADRSVWYGFTAPVEGSLLVTVDSDTSFEPQVVVARGSSLATLTNLFATSIFGGATIVNFRTDVQGGSNYAVRVDGRKNFIREGTFTTALTFDPDPSNDNYASRSNFTGNGGVATNEDNFGADAEAGEPYHPTNDQRSVWYGWTAPSEGSLQVTVNGHGTFNPRAAYFRGNSLATLTNLFSVGSASTTLVQFRQDVIGGSNYALQVDAITNRAEGRFTVTWDFVPDPPNDDFAGRSNFTGNGGVATNQYNFGADVEAGEPLTPTNDQRTVWYGFVPASEGSLLVTVDAVASFNPRVVFFRGSSLATLTNLGSFGSTGGTLVQFRQDVFGGSNYALQVDAFTNRAEGEFIVTFDFDPDPPNDDFASRSNFTGNGGVSATQDNFGADAEIGEPLSPTNDQRTVWYGYTPPSEGSLLVTVDAVASFNPRVVFLRGSSLATLTNLGSFGSTGGTLVQFRQDVFGGSNYAIQVDAFTNRAEGEFIVTVDFDADPGNDDYANRTVISSTGAVLVAEDNFGADNEAGEPLTPTNDQRTVWYGFTAPSEGSVLVTVDGDGSFNPCAKFYRGNSLATLTNLGAFGNTLSTIAQFRQDVFGGSNYALQVDAFTNRAEGSFTVFFDFDADPANDDFATRTIVGGGGGDFTNQDNFGADAEAGEPLTPTNDQRTVWYGFTPPGDGSLQVTVNGHSIYNPRVSFHRGDSLVSLSNLFNGGTTVGTIVQFRQDVSAGTNYVLQIDSFTNRQEMQFTVAFDYDSDPPNDDFASRSNFTGNGGVSATQDNFGADAEIGEPLSPTNDQRTVWYGYTPSSEGSLLVTVDAVASFNPRVVFFRGSSLATLTNLGSFGSTGGTLVQFRQDVFGGSNYALQVDAFTNRAEGEFIVTFDFDPDPPNDEFVNRTIFAGSATNANQYNFGADVEGSESAPNTNTAGRSVWYGFSPGAEGSILVTVDADGSFEPQVTLARGNSLAGLTNLQDTGGFDAGTIVQFRQDVQAGSNYVIRVDGRQNFIHEGTFTVFLSYLPDPPNDDFANRTIITGTGDLLTNQYNFGADIEGGETPPNTNTASRSVWYGFTPASEGSLLVTVDSDASYEPQVTLARGSSLASLTNLLDTGGIDAGTIVQFRQDVQAGSNYVVRVDGRKNFIHEGMFVLKVDFDQPRPINDDFANALNLVGSTVFAKGHNRQCTKETDDGEPNHAGNPGGKSAWWRWTAPFTGGAEFTFRAADFSGLVGIYTGASLSDLDGVASLAAATGTVAFSAHGGNTYRMAIDGPSGTSGNFEFEINLLSSLMPAEFTGSVLAGNLYRTDILGAAGGEYLLQRSANLIDWFNTAYVVPGMDGTVVFVDLVPTNSGPRFYRALTSP